MKRQVFHTNYGEDFIRHTVRIEGEESPTKGAEGFKAMMTLLQTFAFQPDLLRHGSDCPETVKIFADKNGWVVEAATVVPRG